MLVVLETTKWDCGFPVPNHIYFINKSRDRLFGYLPFGKTDPQWYPETRSFNAKGRKFLVLEEAPDLQESIERPSGSNQPPNKPQMIYL